MLTREGTLDWFYRFMHTLKIVQKHPHYFIDQFSLIWVVVYIYKICSGPHSFVSLWYTYIVLYQFRCWWSLYLLFLVFKCSMTQIYTWYTKWSFHSNSRAVVSSTLRTIAGTSCAFCNRYLLLQPDVWFSNIFLTQLRRKKKLACKKDWNNNRKWSKCRSSVESEQLITTVSLMSEAKFNSSLVSTMFHVGVLVWIRRAEACSLRNC